MLCPDLNALQLKLTDSDEDLLFLAQLLHLSSCGGDTDRMQGADGGGRKTWAAAGSIHLKETDNSKNEALGAQVVHDI